jgi:hypothetical protein
VPGELAQRHGRAVRAERLEQPEGATHDRTGRAWWAPSPCHDAIVHARGAARGRPARRQVVKVAIGLPTSTMEVESICPVSDP